MQCPLHKQCVIRMLYIYTKAATFPMLVFIAAIPVIVAVIAAVPVVVTVVLYRGRLSSSSSSLSLSFSILLSSSLNC